MNIDLIRAAGIILILGTRASAVETSVLRDRYFSASWSAVAPAYETLPPVKAAPVKKDGGPIRDTHNPVAHMDITRKAYEIYAAQFGGGELARYIGEASQDKPQAESEDNVVAGSFDEDKAFKNPWNQMFPMANHFWECREGLYKGWDGNDSSVNRAHKYWSGGYGIEGQFDSGWEDKGVKDEGVLGLYRKGDKAKAYWYLGHVAHLVEDITVPAHALLFTHIGDGADAYETYMKNHYKEWTPGPQAPIESFAKLYDLFYQTASITNDFDAGSGPDSGADGKKDKGSRRAGGFTEEQLKEEGRTLMPLAYRRVAALYLFFFFKQIDKNPPKVTLFQPISTADEVVLQARAFDEISGVDLRGYKFEYRSEGENAWRGASAGLTGPSVRFVGEPGRSYSFRVTARDAAGNTATSSEKSWSVRAQSVARR